LYTGFQYFRDFRADFKDFWVDFTDFKDFRADFMDLRDF